MTTDQRPSDIRNYAGVRDTPLILGAVLALLAVGTLTNVLLTGVRRRRRDLAVLQTLGVPRTQVIRMVSWQASALAVAALLAGLPLGVLAGRWSWDLFAGSAGVVPQAEVPVPLVLLTIPAALLLANLIAQFPDGPQPGAGWGRCCATNELASVTAQRARPRLSSSTRGHRRTARPAIHARSTSREAAAAFQANTGTCRCTPVTRTARTCAWA